VLHHRLASSARCLSSRRKREDFGGYKQLHFYFGFQFLWGIAVFDCEKVNFDAEKVANLPTA